MMNSLQELSDATWVIVLAGAGKTSVIDYLRYSKVISYKNTVVFDSELNKGEMSNLLCDDEVQTGNITGNVLMALRKSYNVVVDTTIVVNMSTVRDCFPNVRTIVMHVTALEKTLRSRLSFRSQCGGPYPPVEHEFQKSLQLSEIAAFRAFMPLVHHVIGLDISGPEPRIVHPWHMTWSSLRTLLSTPLSSANAFQQSDCTPSAVSVATYTCDDSAATMTHSDCTEDYISTTVTSTTTCAELNIVDSLCDHSSNSANTSTESMLTAISTQSTHIGVENRSSSTACSPLPPLKFMPHSEEFEESVRAKCTASSGSSGSGGYAHSLNSKVSTSPSDPGFRLYNQNASGSCGHTMRSRTRTFSRHSSVRTTTETDFDGTFTNIRDSSSISSTCEVQDTSSCASASLLALCETNRRAGRVHKQDVDGSVRGSAAVWAKLAKMTLPTKTETKITTTTVTAAVASAPQLTQTDHSAALISSIEDGTNSDCGSSSSVWFASSDSEASNDHDCAVPLLAVRPRSRRRAIIPSQTSAPHRSAENTASLDRVASFLDGVEYDLASMQCDIGGECDPSAVPVHREVSSPPMTGGRQDDWADYASLSRRLCMLPTDTSVCAHQAPQSAAALEMMIDSASQDFEAGRDCVGHIPVAGGRKTGIKSCSDIAYSTAENDTCMGGSARRCFTDPGACAHRVSSLGHSIRSSLDVDVDGHSSIVLSDIRWRIKDGLCFICALDGTVKKGSSCML